MRLTEFLSSLGIGSAKPARGGKTSKATSPEDRAVALDAAINQLVSERDAANIALRAAADERRRLLLNGEDDAVEALEEGLEVHRRTVERCDLQEPVLRQHLAEVRGVLFAKLVDHHRDAGRAAFMEVQHAIREALAANDRAKAAYEAAERELGGQAQTHGVVPVAFGAPLNAEAVDWWAQSNASVLFAAAAVDRKPAPSAPLPAPKVESDPAHQAAVCPPPVLAPLKPSAREPMRIDGPVPDGRTGIVFLRAGVELGDGIVSAIGDKIALPTEQARKLVMSGAADMVSEVSHG